MKIFLADNTNNDSLDGYVDGLYITTGHTLNEACVKFQQEYINQKQMQGLIPFRNGKYCAKTIQLLIKQLNELYWTQIDIEKLIIMRDKYDCPTRFYKT